MGQWDIPNFVYVPAEQFLQECITPTSFPYFPLGHDSLDNVVGQYAPFGHIVQSFGFVDPAVRATVPKGQFWHTVCPVWLLYFPAGHNSFDAVFGQYAPIEHIVQSLGFVDPADRATVPREQFWHANSVVCPVWLLYLPAGQAVAAPPAPVQ